VALPLLPKATATLPLSFVFMMMAANNFLFDLKAGSGGLFQMNVWPCQPMNYLGLVVWLWRGFV
jgi:hypothetical protein